MDNNPVSDSELLDRKYSQASILLKSRRLNKTSDNEQSDAWDARIVSPIVEVGSIAEAVAHCNKPVCDDADMQCIMDLVDGTLCEALTILQSDPRGLFCYKFPGTPKNTTAKVPTLLEVQVTDTVNEREGATTFATTVAISDYGPSSGSSGLLRKPTTIGAFEYSNVLSEIQDFVGQWQLSPDTKCAVLSNPTQHDIPIKGKIYFVDAHFSRPTPRCPNPLAVAKVRFIITVSKVMQKHYPVMITYRFEGHNTLYYAVGERSLNSFTFQRFYIDTILHTKLAFYAEVCECRHGTVEKPKKSKKGKP
ncbi:uncharacterized protein LOC117592246 [Drosophila guanche]|uniref:Uncharacterized protein n=1 Tax=Drosophila guanche TaxID=7266 RepID=A0A3B0J054_DROGU|nr:uncharacterized protein LOC117592246 [Drosophila guanche]SPP73887.1 Hypothetical predicted protein [Drosophila guanche]